MARKRGELYDWLKLERVRQPDGTFKSHRELCEDAQPTAARALLMYIDLGIDGPVQYDRGNHGRQRRASRKRAHPAVMAAQNRRHAAAPDETEKKVQRVKHKIGQVVRDGDGWLETLRVIAEELAPQLQIEHDLIGEEHRAAIVEYLVGTWGLSAKQFPLRPGLPGYLEWREASRLIRA